MVAPDLGSLIYLIDAQQEALAQTWLNTLKAQIFSESDESFNFDRFDAREIQDVDRLTQTARTLPMLGQQRLVLVTHAEVLLGFSKDRCLSLIEYLNDPHPTTVIAFYCQGKIPKQGALAKALLKHATKAEFAPPKEREMLGWLNREVGKHFRTLDVDAARTLVDYLGTDIQKHQDALSKLILYVAEGQKITVADVDKFAVPERTKTVWEWLDAIGLRQPVKSLELTAQLIRQGESPIQLNALLVRFFRQVSIGRERLVQGQSLSEAAKAAGVRSFKEAVFNRQCKSFSERDLTQIRQKLGELDYRLKSSRIPNGLWLESTVIDICAPGD